MHRNRYNVGVHHYGGSITRTYAFTTIAIGVSI